jgi:hypothetical protein
MHIRNGETPEARHGVLLPTARQSRTDGSAEKIPCPNLCNRLLHKYREATGAAPRI